MTTGQAVPIQCDLFSNSITCPHQFRIISQGRLNNIPVLVLTWFSLLSMFPFASSTACPSSAAMASVQSQVYSLGRSPRVCRDRLPAIATSSFGSPESFQFCWTSQGPGQHCHPHIQTQTCEEWSPQHQPWSQQTGLSFLIMSCTWPCHY